MPKKSTSTGGTRKAPEPAPNPAPEPNPVPEPDVSPEVEDEETVQFSDVELPGKVWENVIEIINSRRENGVNMGIIRETRFKDAVYTSRENKEETGVLLTIEYNFSRRPGIQAEFDQIQEERRKLTLNRRSLIQKQDSTEDDVLQIQAMNADIERLAGEAAIKGRILDTGGAIDDLEFLFADWMTDTYVMVPVVRSNDADVSL